MSLLQEKKKILIDSRNFGKQSEELAKKYIFFAINGERHNGANYIEDLYQKGVREFVVEQISETQKSWKDAVFHQVPSVLRALQKMVLAHRENFHYPMIGITGSNGKTIVKEWLFQLLENDFQIAKSPKSYNSQIGVPLSVWQLDEKHNLGIFEAGISETQEMELLQKIIQPTIGIFTNIGSAHSEGFKNQTQKIKEKLQLFKNCETLIFCYEHDNIRKEIQQLGIKTLSWGTNKAADISIKVLFSSNNQTQFQLVYKQQKTEFQFPFSDAASLENGLHCIATMLYLGLSFEQIKQQLPKLKSIPMRLELKQGNNNCFLIDDSYNNDFAGLNIALEFMKQQSGNKKRALIISDMLQSGLFGSALYAQINQLLVSYNIEKLIGIGSQISEFKDLFELQEKIFFPSTKAFLKSHLETSKTEKTLSFRDEFILIKGARKFEFEKISAALQQKIHGTRLEINLNALTHNLNFYKSLLKPKTKIMAMVKAAAYGSGNDEIAALLQFHKVDYLGVAYTDEGISLRKYGIKLPIMVMNPTSEGFQELGIFDIEPEIYSLSLLQKFIAFLERNPPKQKVKIHLKLDTGMNRLGFLPNELETIISVIKNCQYLEVASIFSHLATADEVTENDFTLQQLALFEKSAQELEQKLGYSVIKHCLNSAGIAAFPEYQFGMVRLGIGLYGVDTTGLFQEKLQFISTLKTSISQLKFIPKGATIGYGRNGKVTQNTKIAIIAIGYADGYNRSFSNGVGSVLIRGKLVPIIGTICMDMCMVDVSEIEEIQLKDEVIIFGESPTIIELGKQINTISYEILTNVNERVKRVFYLE